jgi:hypothetical protein
MTFGNAEAYASFNTNPIAAKIPKIPAEPGPYAFDRIAETVDLNLLTSRDEGYTSASVLFSMMEGDASLPAGPYHEIRILEPFGEEGLEDGQTHDDLPLFLVQGFDARCTLPYPIVLSDAEGVFATIPMDQVPFEEIRRKVNEAVSIRLGGAGSWKSVGGGIHGKAMHVPIVRT